MNTPGGNQELSIINESGLYSLILTSRKPEAKKFKKWVTSEVLPAIRKTGRYLAPQIEMPRPLSPDQIKQLNGRIWCLSNPFYMQTSIQHWLFKYCCARAGVTRRDLIPAALFPEMQDFLDSIRAAVDVYRKERIRHEKDWLIQTLKRELDRRLGRLGPEFEILTAPAADGFKPVG